MNIFTGSSEIYQDWFRLDTPRTSYVMAVTGQGLLLQLYYGSKLDDESVEGLLIPDHADWFPPRDGETLLDKIPLVFSSSGMADLRPPALSIDWADGDNIADLRYDSCELVKGKPFIENLPATYVEAESEANTLIIILKDNFKNLRVKLYFTAFENLDAITRHVELTNLNDNLDLHIKKIMSVSLDFAQPVCDRPWELLHMHGAWIREFTPERIPVAHCTQSISSFKGASGHQHNPFAALVSSGCSETGGEAYGFSLLYSGNFLIETDVDSNDKLRINIGLNDRGFSWKLKPGENFITPEAVLVYSADGLAELSKTYHKLYRSRLCRGYWRDKPRPVLLNTWESVYFDFDKDKLLSLAGTAAEAGIELFVLDDGWFGKRDDDRSSLGDWVVNEQKLGCTITQLSDEINKLGMKFGIWVEPEMVSPDSGLYRAHPDWALCRQGRPATLARAQLILDLSRPDVQDYIITSMSNIFESADIAYVKWDMNRNMTEIGSASGTPAGELPHRYMLGLYRILETLVSRFPHILFESCASGGGRFDPGMLYYMPQTWLSDNSDAIARVTMQYGASFVYPASSFGSHISSIPNHQLMRNTPLQTRYHIASTGGGFGYELNMQTLSKEEKDIMKEQIGLYKKGRSLWHDCDTYRLGNPVTDNVTAIEQVAADRSALAVTAVRKLNNIHPPKKVTFRLLGLDLSDTYQDVSNNRKYSAELLMRNGITLTLPVGDFTSARILLSKIAKKV